MTCNERKDQILQYAAGSLDEAEREELRAHLDTGCPQCAGALAEAEALLAQLPFALDAQQPGENLKQRLMMKIAATPAQSLSIAPRPRDWSRIIIPSSIAAILAVAVILAAVYRFRTSQPRFDAKDLAIAELREMVKVQSMQLSDRDAKLAELQKKLASVDSMKFAELKGDAQPKALGRVFLDLDRSQWYFFTSGMSPAPAGKTYELWLIADEKKIPAGTFEVGNKGDATLLGNVPALPAGANVKLAVTDEPIGSKSTSPTGAMQIIGTVN